jgi:hypothetical protein
MNAKLWEHTFALASVYGLFSVLSLTIAVVLLSVSVAEWTSYSNQTWLQIMPSVARHLFFRGSGGDSKWHCSSSGYCSAFTLLRIWHSLKKGVPSPLAQRDSKWSASLSTSCCPHRFLRRFMTLTGGIFERRRGPGFGPGLCSTPPAQEITLAPDIREILHASAPRFLCGPRKISGILTPHDDR